MSAREYARALERLFALGRRGVELDLLRIEQVAHALGSPQETYPVFHIGGTNGKGSTAAMIESVLRATGRRVGLYTSPHLSRFTERIRVGGMEIDPADVLRLLRMVEGAHDAGRLTFFEIVTLMALVYFREQRVDTAVLEVGLGGRLDATNILRRPVVTVVTGVALDHEEYLGRGLAAIAREKAGIFKRDCPAVAAAGGIDEVESTLAAMAAQVGAPLLLHGRDFDVVPPLRYQGPGGPLELPRLGLQGRHQMRNAACALAALGVARRAGFEVSDEARRRGLLEVEWPARFERVPADPEVILDCAHNPDAARALRDALIQDGKDRIVLVFGALADKDARAMLEPLAQMAVAVILVRAPSPRAAGPRALRRMVPLAGAQVAKDVPAALEAARLEAHRSGAPIVVTGSTYLCGAARRLLLGEAADPIAVGDPLPRP